MFGKDEQTESQHFQWEAAVNSAKGDTSGDRTGMEQRPITALQKQMSTMRNNLNITVLRMTSIIVIMTMAAR